MAVNQKRRQKKLMKKRQKDKARKREQAGSTPFALLTATRKILQARTFPVYECLINPSWKEGGLATILLSRRQPNGHILFGFYLVDIYCLGLKNTFCNADFSLWKYETEVRRKIHPEENPVECPISLAHQIIYGGIEFAAQFGFSPNKDFKLSQYVLEDKSGIAPCQDIEFGKDGHPFYIAGPDDNVEYIIRQLNSKVGERNFKSVYSLGELASHENR